MKRYLPLFAIAIQSLLAQSSIGNIPGFSVDRTGKVTLPDSTRDVGSRLKDVLSVKDFGAKGDGATDDLASINSALTTAAATTHRLEFPAGTYMVSAPVNIPASMSQGTIKGYSGATYIKATPGFTGASVITAAGTLADFWLEDVIVDASSLGGITSVVNLTCSPEDSNQHHLRHVQIANPSATATGFVLDGCEDSTLENSFVASNGTGYAVKWNVPGGNLHIFGSTFFEPLDLQYQTADITGTTFGAIHTGAVAWSLVVNGGYSYASVIGGARANFFGNATDNNPNNIVLNGTFMTLGAGGEAATFAAFHGVYNGSVRLIGTTIDGIGNNNYTVVDSGVTAFSGTKPSFILDGSPQIGLSAASIGTPGANVYIVSKTQPQTTYGFSLFTGSNPPVQNGARIPVKYPSRITRVLVQSTGSATGCSTPAQITTVGTGGVTLANGAALWDTGPINQFTSSDFSINVQTQALGCSVFPANLHVTVEMQPQ